MNTRNRILLAAAVVAGMANLAGTAGAVASSIYVKEPFYAGRRADHVPLQTVPAAKRAELAALTPAASSVRTEPPYAGRRADHIPAILTGAKERVEFAATAGKAGAPWSEPPYAGRRADHLEMLRR